jgi:hypothetical protein
VTRPELRARVEGVCHELADVAQVLNALHVELGAVHGTALELSRLADHAQRLEARAALDLADVVDELRAAAVSPAVAAG